MATVEPTDDQIQAAFSAVRLLANESVYGGLISDDICMQIAQRVATAVLNVPAKKEIRR